MAPSKNTIGSHPSDSNQLSSMIIRAEITSFPREVRNYSAVTGVLKVKPRRFTHYQAPQRVPLS